MKKAVEVKKPVKIEDDFSKMPEEWHKRNKVPEVRKPKVVIPEMVKVEKVKVETIKAEKVIFRQPPKFEVLTNVPLPDGHVRVLVLKDHKGMLDELYAGDIIDVPERRFKSMAFRGFVKEYIGGEQPNKRR